MRQKTAFVLAAIFLTTLAVRTALAASAQNLKVRLVEEMSLGDDESADLEYLFATPTVIAVADDGSFYVGEHGQKTIRHFDAEGKHLETFGGPGKAPGEFTEFSEFLFNESGDLVVVDRLGQRITRFPSDGGDPDARILVTDRLYQAFAAAPLSEGRIAMAAGIGYAPDGKEEYGLISVFGSSFDAPKATLAAAGDLFDLESPFGRRRVTGSSSIKMASDGNRTVYVARRIYDGEIVRFMETGDGWTQQVLHGFDVKNPPFRLLDKSLSQMRADGDDLSRYKRLVFMSGDPDPFNVDYWAASKALFVRPDGTLIHFFETDYRNATVLMAEMFDAVGTYLGFGEVMGFEAKEGSGWPYVRLYPEALDDKDRLYCVDTADSGAVILVMRLEIDP